MAYRFAWAVVGLAAFSAPARAQDPQDKIRELEARIEAQDARIRSLEQMISEVAGKTPEAEREAPAVSAVPSAPAAVAGVDSHPTVASSQSRLHLSGDLRLREEFNWSGETSPDRTRTVMRARLRARYKLDDKISLGAGIATGDPDNPNSTDVTVSDFADGLDVSLDQLYARFAAHDFVFDIGKFPQIFRRTDLVWDGDVNPQGVGVRYEHSLGAASSIDARALYFIVDEAAAGAGSSMIGGQVGLATALADGWVLDAGVGYLDYHLSGISGGDAGDFRSNLLRPDGSYLSDFDLLELVGSIHNHSIDPPLPIEVRFDFVRNLGAATSADTGYLAELVLGTARRRGDFRLGYGYAVAETDAVFAAFSHDNIELATNYQLHSLAADYLPLENVILNLTYYRYRPFQREPDTLHGWRNRLRLNLMFEF